MLVALTGASPEGSAKSRRSQAFIKLAQAARNFELPFLVSTPLLFDVRAGRVAGWQFDAAAGEAPVWQKCELRMRRTVVYDAMYLRDLLDLRSRYHQLRRELRGADVPVFNPIFPSKHQLYRMLQNTDLGSGRLPATQFKLKPREIIDGLSPGGAVWLKPLYGSGGQNIVFIKQIGDRQYLVVAERLSKTSFKQEMDRHKLRRLLSDIEGKRDYLVQEDLPLVCSAEGRKIDFRLTVQRDETGMWKNTATTARFGSVGSVLTNFHAGGNVVSLSNMSTQSVRILEEIGEDRRQLEEFRQIAVKVAAALEQHLPSLGLLGVDIGLTVQGEKYAYDFNGRPGRDILTVAEVAAMMRAAAGYARYLFENGTNP